LNRKELDGFPLSSQQSPPHSCINYTILHILFLLIPPLTQKVFIINKLILCRRKSKALSDLSTKREVILPISQPPDLEKQINKQENILTDLIQKHDLFKTKHLLYRKTSNQNTKRKLSAFALIILTTATMVYSAQLSRENVKKLSLRAQFIEVLEFKGSFDVKMAVFDKVGVAIVRETESADYRQYVERLSGEACCEDE
jgi:uncharacterized membrane protein YbaN (DUF454 family)